MSRKLLLARAGRPDDALAELRTALRLDLDDLTGTTAGGLHLATMGGCWQAVLFGFTGASVNDGVLPGHADITVATRARVTLRKPATQGARDEPDTGGRAR